MNCVLVAGAGTMGQQIALQCATHGCRVILYDIAQDALAAAGAQISLYASHLVRGGGLTSADAEAALARIERTTAIRDAEEADLVTESVPEDVALKARVFAELNEVCPARTIFTTNTSFLVPSMIADATGRAAQFAALHFHGYVWVSNVVDIMPHPGTAPETVALLAGFARRIGQIPIVLKQETPGYVFNSMLGAVNREAMRLVANGIATVEDVDRSWMGVMRMPIGPFGILDQVGIETAWHITEWAAGATGDPLLRVNADFLKSYVERGWLGLKTGRGFYTYPDPLFERPEFLTGA
jgi:3-hydroxybutyryl-CoA dehydrogenase